MAGDWSEELQQNPQYLQLLEATNRICHKLRNYQNNKSRNDYSGVATKLSCTTPEIESEMQEFVQMVLQNDQDGIRSTFFLVAKNFYYVAFFNSQTNPLPTLPTMVSRNYRRSVETYGILCLEAK
ncbi:Gly-Xaa carboxypeptidase [Stylosanthes scabra]|uniref:Gly-Xaa carboxypeptidase n=1 Tax=Stylosanthes scabra TaxID=79078 RepID=A0ABU6UMR3_9FABA|nr:Gly-Xaa carboxypeptidase [Stylosanthes scabra]